jgi:glycine hydroxymethyltransferase
MVPTRASRRRRRTDNRGLSGRSRPGYFDRYGLGEHGRLDELIALERGMLRDRLHLIASASYPFESVLRALGEPIFVFPTEGMPGARYLPGSNVIDVVETEGEALVLGLFGNPDGYRATLQPHSGTQANQIAYNAVLKPDDAVLCLRASDGGHISHTVLISRRHETFNYRLAPDGRLDYDHLRTIALEKRPKLIIVGGSALPRAVDFEICGEIARDCGAYLHADVSHHATFIAAGLHPSVFPHCDFVTFNTMKNLRGPNGGVLLYRLTLAKSIHASIFPTTQGGPNESVMFAKFAVFLEWQHRDIVRYAQTIVRTARELGLALQRRGIELVTGGTDSHILLLDLQEFGVLANRNLVPGDTRPPLKTSGLRIGSTNLAILGYTAADLEGLGSWLADVIDTGHADREIIKDLLDRYQRGQ